VDLDPGAVLEAMATDKKHGGGPRLVLLRAPGQAELLPAPERDVLVAAVRTLAGGRGSEASAGAAALGTGPSDGPPVGFGGAR
jgi:hypothetical protein